MLLERCVGVILLFLQQSMVSKSEEMPSRTIGYRLDVNIVPRGQGELPQQVAARLSPGSYQAKPGVTLNIVEHSAEDQIAEHSHRVHTLEADNPTSYPDLPDISRYGYPQPEVIYSNSQGDGQGGLFSSADYNHIDPPQPELQYHQPKSNIGQTLTVSIDPEHELQDNEKSVTILDGDKTTSFSVFGSENEGIKDDIDAIKFIHEAYPEAFGHKGSPLTPIIPEEETLLEKYKQPEDPKTSRQFQVHHKNQQHKLHPNQQLLQQPIQHQPLPLNQPFQYQSPQLNQQFQLRPPQFNQPLQQRPPQLNQPLQQRPPQLNQPLQQRPPQLNQPLQQRPQLNQPLQQRPPQLNQPLQPHPPQLNQPLQQRPPQLNQPLQQRPPQLNQPVQQIPPQINQPLQHHLPQLSRPLQQPHLIHRPINQPFLNQPLQHHPLLHTPLPRPHPHLPVPQPQPFLPYQPPMTNVHYTRPAVPVPQHGNKPRISLGAFVEPVRNPTIMNDCNPVAKTIWTFHEECDGVPQKRWNLTFPMCGGRLQSPISLSSANTPTRAVPLLEFGPGYRRTTQQVEFINTGNGLEVIFRDNNDLILQGGNLRFVYQLVKIVLTSHALHPEDNLRHPLEMQFIHVKYGSTFQEALFQKDGIVILSVRMTGSNPIPIERLAQAGLRQQPITRQTQKLIDSLSYLIEPAGHVHEAHKRQIRILFLRLEDLVSGVSSGLYVYKGSLPHPPCIEGITWMIPKGIPAIPFEIMDQLTRKLHSMLNTVNLPVTTNYRSTQPRNGRPVEVWIPTPTLRTPYYNGPI